MEESPFERKQPMKVVTEIQYMDVEDNYLETRSLVDPLRFNFDEYNKVVTHIIRGRTFVNRKGERICLGVAPGVQELLGLPFDTIDDLQLQVDRYRNEAIDLCQKIFDISNTNFWGRLKFLFTKKI